MLRGAMPKRPDDAVPPTMAHLRSHGVTHAWVTCLSCYRSARADLSKARDDAVFIDLRFRCAACGSRNVQARPDWPSGGGYRP